MKVKLFRRTLAVLLLAFVACSSFGATWITCSNCGDGAGQDSCYWANTAASIKTGYWYDLESECEKSCNGPTESNCKTCSVSIAEGDQKKYYINGSIGFGDWGLSAGWESLKTFSSGCSYSDSCGDPNCCAGPAYAYLKYSYTQKYKGYWNATQSNWCKDCSIGSVGDLRTFSNVLCGSTAHSGYEPDKSTVSAYCTEQGQ